jgi:nicotinic acid mononucleotide adenylyltransferase
MEAGIPGPTVWLPMLDALPALGAPIFIGPHGAVSEQSIWNPDDPTPILPGAFNPLHAGHRGLAQAASQLLRSPIAFELSVANVDKPLLDITEVRRRALQFTGNTALWLTQAPRFVDKADLFPGATFVVGADTALRIVDPRYYADPAAMVTALRRIGERGCQFLVACRVDVAGICLQLADIALPPAFRELFTAIPVHVFRLDISSTAIRRASAPTQAADPP